MKKLLSVILSVCILCAVLTPVLAADAAVDARAYPTIYVVGKLGKLYNDYGTPEQTVIYDGNNVPAPEGYADAAVEELVPLFIRSVLTDDYDEWVEKVSSVLEPVYRDFVLDKDGKARPGSRQETWWKDNPVTDKAENGLYNPNDYSYFYDWRLSPLDVVADLNEYIDAVLAATGKDKVNLQGRCEGACVVMAYLYRYGAERVNSTVLLTPSSNGVSLIGNLFAGDLHVDGDSVNRYLQNGQYMSDLDSMIEDELTRRLLLDTLKLMAVTPGIDFTDVMAQKILEKVLPRIMPGMLMTSYGTLPAYWAMVDDAHYEDAKKLAGIADDPEYANFVLLIDEYHYQVQNRHAEILQACKDQGMGLAILVKYGDEMLPFFADSIYPNDNTVTVRQASLGATMAPYGEKLDGEGEFISPDGLIDASTCAFPENTWFVKYVEHSEWGRGVARWYNAFYASGAAMTVDADPAYPRYCVYDMQTGVMEPMTGENAFSPEKEVDEDVGGALTDFVATVRRAIVYIVTFIKGFVYGIISHAKGTAEPVAIAG
ncbi:MAG: alpha/beta fold hydrolase [Clostridia bacterium]|nr:alpha/beta fold hydrolase [Clostridia bacterium]